MIHPPYRIPAAWTAAELENHPDFHQHFSQQDLQEIDSALHNCQQRNLQPSQITSSIFPLSTLRHKLEQWIDIVENGLGVIIINGLQTSRYSFDEQQLLCGIGAHLGITRPKSGMGEHIMTLQDEGYKLYTPNARGTNTHEKLDFHTDTCDMIAMLSLQNAANGGESNLVSAVAIYNELYQKSPELLKIL